MNERRLLLVCLCSFPSSNSSWLHGRWFAGMTIQRLPWCLNGQSLDCGSPPNLNGDSGVYLDLEPEAFSIFCEQSELDVVKLMPRIEAFLGFSSDFKWESAWYLLSQISCALKLKCHIADWFTFNYSSCLSYFFKIFNTVSLGTIPSSKTHDNSAIGTIEHVILNILSEESDRQNC